MENHGILNSTGDTSVVHNSRYGSAVYNGSSGTSTVSNLTSDNYSSKEARTITVTGGTIDLTGGTYNVRNSTLGRGILVESGTINSRGTTFNIHDNTDSQGIYVNNGTANIESGSFTITGTNSYGAILSKGTLNLGVQGTPVSTTSPFISAVGTTKGIGISMGLGYFNYYDGKVTANTRDMDENNLETSVETNYQVVHYPADIDNPYPYMIIESMY